VGRSRHRAQLTEDQPPSNTGFDSPPPAPSARCEERGFLHLSRDARKGVHLRSVGSRADQWFDSTTPHQRTTSGQWQTTSDTEDAGGSTPPSSAVAEVEVDDTPGCGPGGSRFESGRSPHRSGRSGDQRGLIRRASRVRSPLPPPPGQLHRKQRLPCKETAAGSTPAWSTHERAHVAQLGEAPRSDRG
jgi:hypothetical protein